MTVLWNTKGNRTIVTLKTKKALTLQRVYIPLEHTFGKDDVIFANGWQSWTDSKEFAYGEALNDVKKRLPKVALKAFAFDRYGDYFKQYEEGNIHGYDVGYIKGQDPLFIGSYNFNTAYLVINCYRSQNKITLESDVGGLTLPEKATFTLFDFEMGDLQTAKQAYFATFKPRQSPKMIGYTSWYNHYQNINEKLLLENLEAMDERFKLFQIDDGYQTHVGDWLDVDARKFPNGLKPIVDNIHQKGLLAGLWMAPFSAEQNSKLVAEHPDWLLCQGGEPVKAGCNWGGFYGLDFYNAEVQDHVRTVLQAYVDMGFDFFKFDFLYSVTQVIPANKTRAQVTYDSYQFLRDTLGDKLILGCGGVLSNASQLFDYMRIGTDVSLAFDDVWFMRMMHRERVSTKLTVQNTVYRSMFDGAWFGCDPDVFLLRDGIGLNKEQKKSLATLNALFGSVLMTSDNFADYDQDKKEFLSHILALFERATVVSYARKDQFIHITYELDGEQKSFNYDTKKGVMYE